MIHKRISQTHNVEFWFNDYKNYLVIQACLLPFHLEWSFLLVNDKQIYIKKKKDATVNY